MTKYRVGDEVTVRGIIKNIEHSRGLSLFVNMGYAELWLSKSDIVTHTPKPREFKTGDMVICDLLGLKYEFIAERDGLAILWNDSARAARIVAKSHIIHADEAE